MRHGRVHSLKAQVGASLIEVMVTVVIILLGLLGLAGLHAAATPSFPGGALFAVHDDKSLVAFDLREVARTLGLKQGCVE